VDSRWLNRQHIVSPPRQRQNLVGRHLHTRPASQVGPPLRDALPPERKTANDVRRDWRRDSGYVPGAIAPPSASRGTRTRSTGVSGRPPSARSRFLQSNGCQTNDDAVVIFGGVGFRLSLHSFTKAQPIGISSVTAAGLLVRPYRSPTGSPGRGVASASHLVFVLSLNPLEEVP
jgi:hypothetical protein